MPAAAERPEGLPDFRNPPLVETVLSLQYAPWALTAAHIGLLWQRFRERFPLVEEHPPLPPALEKFGLPSPTPVEVIIEGRPPTPRVWFLNRDKTELVQVQPDRFIHNWRKLGQIEPYPRYEPIREGFREEVAVLLNFLQQEGLGSPEVTQCEVTYVNHIEPSGVWQPAWRKADRAPLLILNLTARGAPLGEGIEGAFAFFDLARRWIVHAFAELTTAEMHQVWGRTDG